MLKQSCLIGERGRPAHELVSFSLGGGRYAHAPLKLAFLFLLLTLPICANDAAPTHWAYTPLQAPAVPEVADKSWCRNQIDNFILQKLTEQGLTPNPEADRRTLIRRLTYDLHGLPPTAEEIDAFLADTSEQAYEELVDRLLASPRYGERWGRHWLDVVHYGETHGFDKDQRRENAWPYRDYVIRAFNDDKPYTNFIEEQIAGDVLHPNSPNGVVATGFLSAGPWDLVGQAEVRENTVEKARVRNLDRDDILSNAFNTFQSTTIQCARCHNHKFDPISQKEYYSLQAVFAGVDRGDRDREVSEISVKRDKLLRRLDDLKKGQNQLNAKIEELALPELSNFTKQEKETNAAIAALEKSKSENTSPSNGSKVMLEKNLYEISKSREEFLQNNLPASLLNGYNKLKERVHATEKSLSMMPKPDKVYTVKSVAPREIHILARGSESAPGDRAFPEAWDIFPDVADSFANLDPSNEGAARIALAKWITSPQNPLTWRSIVNRIWQYHFGRGIVETPNDFGKMGAAPTHPELLDWLATEFKDNSGSFKHLHKIILMSATYRQSSGSNEANAALDASNRFLWRANRYKQDADTFRDSILYASGALDLKMGGPSVDLFEYTVDESPRYEYTDFDKPAVWRRSVYRTIVRSVPDPFMEALDCADPNISIPVRNNTLTATQALATLNDAFVLNQAKYYADALRGVSDDLDLQLRTAYMAIFARVPTDEELRISFEFAQTHGLENALRVFWNCNEFMFIN